MYRIRPQFHQFPYGTAGTPYGAFLEVFPHPIKKHYPHRLGIIPQEHGSQGSDAHQEVFIHGAPVPQSDKSRFQDIPPDQQIGPRISRQTEPGIAPRHQSRGKQGYPQDGGYGPNCPFRSAGTSGAATPGPAGHFFKSVFVGMFLAHDLFRLYACSATMASLMLVISNTRLGSLISA